MAQNDKIIEALTEAKANSAETSEKLDKVIAALKAIGGSPEQQAQILQLVEDVRAGIQKTEDTLDAVELPAEPGPVTPPLPQGA